MRLDARFANDLAPATGQGQAFLDRQRVALAGAAADEHRRDSVAVQVLSQSRVFIDLIPGYTGVLIVDGVELPTINIDDVGEQFEADPGQQIDLPATTIFEPGNYTLTFVPSDDALVDKFETGPHQARVIYWKITEGRQFARSYGWTFNVV